MQYFTKENIQLKDGLFKGIFSSDIFLKGYQDLIKKLKKINMILEKTGIEREIVADYLNRKLKEKNSKNLTGKQIEKYKRYARRALRRNIIAYFYPNSSARSLSNKLAMSPDLQNFVLCGDLKNRRCFSKSLINRDKYFLPTRVLKKINQNLIQNLKKKESVEELGLESGIETDTLWIDATCIESRIHFPVDWVLLKDIVISLMKTIATLRSHGIKNRMEISPAKIMSKVNKLSMEITNIRNKPGAVKKRKEILRKLKKMVKIVVKHAERHIKKLKKVYDYKTDLTEREVENFLSRLQNIIQQVPEAINQAHKRIITQKKVKNEEKILSLHDDNACVVKRGKPGGQVEFGNELFIAEQSDGLIVEWEMYKDKVPDMKKIDDLINQDVVDKYVVQAVVGDRGFDSMENRDKLEELEVYNGIHPRGVRNKSKIEDEAKFKRLHKRRALTEARISILKRFLGGKVKSFEYDKKSMRVGWGVLAHNLSKVVNLEREIELPLTA